MSVRALGYKPSDSRYFAYLAQNDARRGYHDTYRGPAGFTPRQERRMRHKANKHGEDPGYPHFYERRRQRRELRRKIQRREEHERLAKIGARFRPYSFPVPGVVSAPDISTWAVE